MPGYVASGSLTSEVHDARFVSQFGTVSWKADVPEKTSVKVQVRTGNVSEPDPTWSEWSAALTDGSGSKPGVPPGRFVQYRAMFETGAPAETPELRSIALHFQAGNLPPELSKITVPDVSTADGATRQARMALRWDASDPNDDELTFTLLFRKEGWPEWIKLTDPPIAEKLYSWDATAVPAGVYRLKVVASDRPSNPDGSAFSRELVSEPFLVDHQAPTVAISAEGKTFKIALKDDLTRLVKAAYALDGGEWTAIFPDDGLFDSTAETITLKLPDLKPGAHVLTVRATDAAGNVGTGDVVK